MYEFIIGGVLITIILIVIIYLTMTAGGYPSGLTEGMSIRCKTTGGIYKLEGGKKRWFSAVKLISAGSPKYVDIACDIVDSIPDGDAM